MTKHYVGQAPGSAEAKGCAESFRNLVSEEGGASQNGWVSSLGLESEDGQNREDACWTFPPVPVAAGAL